MSLQDSIVRIARSQLGVAEVGGNNVGEDIVKFQRATWLQPGAWPWCAAFVAWCLQQALSEIGVPAAKAETWRCRDASAFGWLAWAQHKVGCAVLPPAAAPQPGDIVVYDFNGPTAAGGGHIGIIESDQPGDPFFAIEGNTSTAGGRDSETGDGVMEKMRGTRSVVGFIRLPRTLP